ncbi:MAG: hypothetical protein AAFR77_09055 [Cyanobacteria bacterium J06631_2]
MKQNTVINALRRSEVEHLSEVEKNSTSLNVINALRQSEVEHRVLAAEAKDKGYE